MRLSLFPEAVTRQPTFFSFRGTQKRYFPPIRWNSSAHATMAEEIPYFNQKVVIVTPLSLEEIRNDLSVETVVGNVVVHPLHGLWVGLEAGCRHCWLLSVAQLVPSRSNRIDYLM